MAKMKVNLKNPQRVVAYLTTPKNEATRASHERAIRAEYTRQRDIAQKRIKRGLARGETLESMGVTQYPLPKLRDIKNTPDLARAISGVTRWTSSKRSTVKGRKEIATKTVQSMQKLGYTEVTEDNVDQFNRFMEQMRRRYEEETPEGRVMFIGSDFLVEAFDALLERGKIGENSNAASIGRAFNDYLRETGNADLIRKAPKKATKRRRHRED